MINPMSLEGKNIIVTGAGQGIGKGIAEMCLDLGANVGIVEFNEKTTKEFADSHDKNRVLAVQGSVADPKCAPAVVEAMIAKFGAVHGLVNNAGVVRAAMIDKMSSATWQEVIDVHLSGSFYFLQAVGRHMIERAKAGDKAPGSIVNISSDAGRRGTLGQINYGAAKSGALGLTMSAAREWGRFNIRVNSILFGMVETQMTETLRGDKFKDTMLAMIPVGRWAQVDEVVTPVCFMLGEGACYITGQHLSVNGGYTIGV